MSDVTATGNTVQHHRAKLRWGVGGEVWVCGYWCGDGSAVHAIWWYMVYQSERGRVLAPVGPHVHLVLRRGEGVTRNEVEVKVVKGC